MHLSNNFQYSQHTHLLYLIQRLFWSPLEAMFTLLVFIVSKDANATPLQLTILIASKPLVSFFSSYISLYIANKTDRIKSYLTLLNSLAGIPCLFFPFVQNTWYIVLAFILFTTASRASFPAWTEILKCNIGLKNMATSISKGATINYVIILFLPFLLSFFMDRDKELWKFLFFFLAVFQATNLLALFFLKINPSSNFHQNSNMTINTHFHAIRKVLMENTPFAKYLLVFGLGGAGIVSAQAAIPIYFNEVLHLSYVQLTTAVSLCKGISFILTSPVWAHYTSRISLYRINFFMNILTCLFFIFIFLANMHLEWLFLGYVMYGAMQAGCEISWNLSGPTFSREEESTLYSSLNLALVGLRGCICPFIGQAIFLYFGIQSLFLTALTMTFLSVIYAFNLDYNDNKQTNFNI